MNIDIKSVRNIQNWHKHKMSQLSFGEKAADHMRNGMGSWTFVLGFIFFMAGWAYVNSSDKFHHWDEFPFILLNLFLSMLAALQGAILLIAARRADAVSAAAAQSDYDTNVAAKQEIEMLMEINQKQLAAIEDLKKLVEKQNRKK